ncbi:MAG: metallophosphoesterase [Coleofasciculaceae cyanobacterium]
MLKRLTSRPVLIAAVIIGFIALAPIIVLFPKPPIVTSAPGLLTDPFLQLPTQTSVRVVWFTEFAGNKHSVAYGQGLTQKASATSIKLTRTREDQNSSVGKQIKDAQIYKKPTKRDIWRHEAIISKLTAGQRVPYQVTSIREDGQTLSSQQFTLTSAPKQQVPLKILLTSDHQLMPMTAANLQKVDETIGKVDAIFMAGDLVNIPDRASEWFDDNRGGAFFPVLQGRANYQLEREGIKTTYKGASLIQYAPLFTATGNHEVMGRFSMESSLNDQFNDAYPRIAAQAIYKKNAKKLNSKNNAKFRENWLTNNSFNTDTYNEIFTQPQGKNYYAITFGDIRLVVLYATNIWRTPSLDVEAKGRYRERKLDLNNPVKWGYGQHIFEPIAKGSEQYQWLQTELNSSQFKQAKYKIVMFHHPPHTLGDNIVPAYTNPIQRIDRDKKRKINSVSYRYPKANDYLIRDVVPLLEKSGVQMVFYGHSHLWNRFQSANGTHFLESSNVGNTYGAYIGNKKRPVPTGYGVDYSAVGDPNGLKPVMPTIAPLMGENQQTLPYIASNDITTFSILDTATGMVSSYRFDTRVPNSDVVKFDEFRIAQPLNLEPKTNNLVALVVISLIVATILISAWLVGNQVNIFTKM